MANVISEFLIACLVFLMLLAGAIAIWVLREGGFLIAIPLIIGTFILAHIHEKQRELNS